MSDIALSGVLNNPVAALVQGSYAISVANEWKLVYQAALAKELAIAQRIQDRANETHQLWSQEIKDCQAAWAAEVCATPVVEPQYDAVQFRVEAESRRQSDTQLRRTLRSLPLTNTGARCDITRTFLLTTASTTAHMSYAYREAERGRVMRLNANRDVLMRQAITQGHQVFTSSSAGLTGIADLYHRQADSAAGAMNGALKVVGSALRTGLETLPDFVTKVGNAMRGTPVEGDVNFMGPLDQSPLMGPPEDLQPFMGPPEDPANDFVGPMDQTAQDSGASQAMQSLNNQDDYQRDTSVDEFGIF